MSDPTYSDLDELNLSTKTFNALRRNKVHTCAQLLRMGRVEVSRLRWIGPAAMREIATGLATTQAMEWTVEGSGGAPSEAAVAQMIEALGQGDSAAIRKGLARVLKVALNYADWAGDEFALKDLVNDLEHGAR